MNETENTSGDQGGLRDQAVASLKRKQAFKQMLMTRLRSS
jgi:hypothetical protein